MLPPESFANYESMAAWQDRIHAWASDTFDHDAQGIALHLLREAIELCKAVGCEDNAIAAEANKELYYSEPKPASTVGEELADVTILAFALAGYQSLDLEAEIRTKHKRNLTRTWKRKEASGLIFHLEEGS